jgi:Tfp pilus assembly protein PilF
MADAHGGAIMTGKRTCIATLLLAATIAAGCSSLPDKLNFVKKDKVDSSKDIKHLNKPVKFVLSYAQWQEERGDLGEARESYKIVISKEPQNLEARLGLARIAVKTGDLEKAEGLFQGVLNEAPGNADVLNSLGQFYAEKRDWPRSVTMLGQAAGLEPENRQYRYQYGAALAHFGRTGEAFTEFRKILSEPEAHVELASILKSEGNWQQAEFHVQRALVLNPKFPEARTLLEELKYSGGEHTRYAQHTSPSGMTPTLPAGYERSANSPAGTPTDSYPGTFDYSEDNVSPLDY